MLVNNNNSNNKYPVSAIKINGKETNRITSTGYTEIELTLDNGKTATVNLEVKNLFVDQNGSTWKIEASGDLSSNCECKKGKLNILLFEGLTFCYYDDIIIFNWSNKQGCDIQGIDADEDEIWNYLNVIIVVNGKEYEHKISKNKSDNKYYASVEDLCENPSSCTVIYEIGPNDGKGFCERFAVTVPIK